MITAQKTYKGYEAKIDDYFFMPIYKTANCVRFLTSSRGRMDVYVGKGDLNGGFEELKMSGREKGDLILMALQYAKNSHDGLSN